jgi:plasmid stabilization system protein ParE
MPELELQLIWSPEAEADLLEIWRWGAVRFSPDTADGHLRDIQRAALDLTVAPLSGRSRSDLRPGLRSRVVIRPSSFTESEADRSMSSESSTGDGMWPRSFRAKTTPIKSLDAIASRRRVNRDIGAW